MKRIMDLTWDALQAIDAGNLELARVIVMVLRTEHTEDFLQQREDVGLVIWRSIQHCEGRPDIEMDSYFHLTRQR